MATSPLQKLDDQITCSVCLDIFRNPKLLQCHHVYCKGCLEELLAISAEVITCPACRKDTPVPREGGVSALDAAFHIPGLIDLRNSLSRNTEGHSYSSLDGIGTGFSSALNNSDGGPVSSLDRSDFSIGAGQDADKLYPFPRAMCPSHEKSELLLYCEMCSEVICFQCTKSQHVGHSYEYIKDVAGKHISMITPLLGDLKNESVRIAKSLAAVDTRAEDVNNLRTSLKGGIHGVFHDLREMLSVRESELVNQLDQVTSVKLKSLECERSNREMLLLRSNSCVQQVQKTLDTNNDVKILSAKKAMVQNMQQTVAWIRDEPNLIEVDTKADMEFSIPLDFASQCRALGQVFNPDSIDPQKCVASGPGLEKMLAGEKTVVYVKLYDFRGNPFVKSIESQNVKCEAVFLPSHNRESWEIRHERENIYELSHIPIKRGEYQLEIRVDNTPIRGSPFPVVCRFPVRQLGGVVEAFSGLVGAWGTAINSKGEVIVSECSGHRLNIFGRDGHKVRSFQAVVYGCNKIRYPRGVSVDGDGNILVANAGNELPVLKFNGNGEFLASGGTKGNERGQFRDPKGIAFNLINNKVYVADVHKVLIMNSDLTFASSFGQFTNAFSIACDSKGNVYVGDSEKKNVKVFTAEGQLVKTILTHKAGSSGKKGGRSESGPGPVSPVGLAVDSLGLMYVSDDIAHQVLVFSPEGVLLAAFGKEGSFPGDFRKPRGIAVTKIGMVYVCDYNNCRVQVF